MKKLVGQIYLFEEGEYADRSTIGPYRVLQEFETAQVVAEFRERPGPAWVKPEDRGFNAWDFLKFLADRRLIEYVDHGEWHLGCYGRGPDDEPDPPPSGGT